MEGTSTMPIVSAETRAPQMGRRSLQNQLKRALDLALGLPALLLVSPIMGLAALAILTIDGPPIFYDWRVVGKNGRPFLSWKFRTMVPDADRRKQGLLEFNEMQGPVFKMRRDPRVTRTGRLLRKYSLDELPQLWSVVKGDMSLVGPRPPLVSEYRAFQEWQKRKLSVTPGLTCLWQVEGRANINDFDHWVRMDLAYIDSWSLSLDLRILWRTVFAVIRGNGAY